MTYGIALRNAAGENLVDVTGGFTYYHKSSGTCINPYDLGVSNTAGSSSSLPLDFANNVWGYYFLPAQPHYNDFLNGVYPSANALTSDIFNDYYQKFNYAGTSFGQIYIQYSYGGYIVRKWFAKPVTTNPEDLVFMEVPSVGLVNNVSHWMNFTGLDLYGNSVDVGLSALAIPHHSYTGGNLKYKVVSTDLPAQQNGNVGLAVYDTDGSLKFDTTRSIASFADHIFLSASDAQDILLNNTTRVYTLRKNVSNMYMQCEGMSSFYRNYTGGTKTIYHLKFRQTASNQVTISREANIKSVGSGTYPTPLITQTYKDALFLIGDFD